MGDNMFFQKVYTLTKAIPRGKVTTYGAIARALGEPRKSSSVGWALHANKDPKVPCHRVVNRNGELAKGFAFGGPYGQKARLKLDGVQVESREIGDKRRYIVDLAKYLWEPREENS